MTITDTLDAEKLRAIQLVREAQTGSREAFGELFQRYERHVFAIALRLMASRSLN